MSATGTCGADALCADLFGDAADMENPTYDALKSHIERLQAEQRDRMWATRVALHALHDAVHIAATEGLSEADRLFEVVGRVEAAIEHLDPEASDRMSDSHE
jgi:hypothetical protein